MDKLIYYSQEDPRWKDILYSNRSDPKQTIAASGCGPTCFAMVASSFIGRRVLPPESAQFAISHGYRTDDNGTSWGFFLEAAKAYGLSCMQTGSLEEAKQALSNGALVIASMRFGHFTGAGHYILLVGIHDKWIDVYDPNPDNRKYGIDGLIREGVKDDGKVTADETVFRREAAQYWIFTTINTNEGDQPMTAIEQKAFEALQIKVEEQSSALTVLTLKIKDLETNIPAPKWFIIEFGDKVLEKIKDPTGTLEFWRSLAVSLRVQGYKKK
ncbi:C39 family peptidase [Cohnella silvisoli]|uniref:C39 family peptidase n=1 Tax=Cohnella silvisoli TaxID=2873699 RepID=A0ABV1L3W6_9BACL|nr:C39 family peptidase [Cohnella silvisoli]MCD9026062.1 C39 family peptidase [Cohnella silvisoli]